MAREYLVRFVRSPWTHAHNHFDIGTNRLNLATVARVNLYALPGPMSFPMALGSVVSLLTALRGKWAGPLRISDHLLAAPDFQRKPVAEMLGLGIAMDIAKTTYSWDGRGPQSLDSLRQYWGRSGSRPDLLFDRSNSTTQFVGEAKGRTLQVVRATAPQVDERRWLNKLHTWYGAVGLQYFLVVAMASPDEVVANVYDPGEPRRVYPEESLESAIRSRDDALWETAPETDGLAYGRSVRGTWMPVLIDDEEGIEASALFFGMLDEGIDGSIEIEQGDWQVSAAGRAIVALHRPRSSDPILDLRAALEFLPSEFLLEIRRNRESIATGSALPTGEFKVRSGSLSRPPMSSLRETDRDLREDLLRSGVLAQGGARAGQAIFTADWVFSSPSAAARLVLGTGADGPYEWQFPDGTRLRDVSR